MDRRVRYGLAFFFEYSLLKYLTVGNLGLYTMYKGCALHIASGKVMKMQRKS